MKSLTIFLIGITLSVTVILLGCSTRQASGLRANNESAKQVPVTPTAESRSADQNGVNQQVSLKDASTSATVAAALDRKIIRNADLTLEVRSPTDAQSQISSIAEQRGGFIVTSESSQRTSDEPGKRLLDIKLIARVPSNQFDNAISSIEKLSTNIIQRNVSGQDVTEEFIDLEARIKTQKALELQFLEIMKQANKVADALEVQRQIADVRTEIERLEGRKRFLENNTSLSTIVVNLKAPMAIVVTTTGFGRSVREAVSESVDIASAILLFLVRFVIVMVPVFVLVLLPAGLIARYLVRRAQRIRLAQALHVTPPAE